MATGEAAAAGHQYIMREHLLMGICGLEKVLSPAGGVELDQRVRQTLQTERDSVEDVFGDTELNPRLLRRQVRKRLGQGTYRHTERVVHRSEACKVIFQRADELAEDRERTSSHHLLAAILEAPGDTIGGILAEADLDPTDLRDRALACAAQESGASISYLKQYGRDLTQEAKEGKLGPYIGRRKELLQVIQTLARRTKNNPVLVGEAGVGKTAIVEALAVRAAEGKDRQVLGDKRIIELNIGALVGGTKYRGDFEERLTRIIEETRTRPDVILFVDEIHNVVGAGQGQGAMDAANLMKPALARGELRCIGATTIAEYRRYIESDSALERRFERVVVNEPSPDETLQILAGLRHKWEEHHQVRITDRALEAAVDLSIRFDSDHQLPDKAIDLVDKAGARVRIPILSMRMDGGRDKAGPGEDAGGAGVGGEVTELTIAQVISDRVGLPLEVITGHLEGMAQSRLLELNAFLRERLIGQDEAVERVCQRLLMAHAGLTGRRGPLSVLLFLGPTGVGKTELARLLAKFLFGSESDMIRLDMSEYMEEHSVSKLVGSPPGYVGHDEEGQLTGKLRTKPYSVVLLDEIEKSHPRVSDLFLQVFDEGRLTDAKGRTADARNAIFIMTSNIPADRHMGFAFHDTEESRTMVLREVGKRFRPEFINRVDEQIVFRSLDEEDTRAILRPILAEMCNSLQQRYGAVLQVTEEVEAFLVHAGYSPRYGARELRRVAERLIQVPLSNLVLSGKLREHRFWKAICTGGGLSIVPTDDADSISDPDVTRRWKGRPR